MERPPLLIWQLTRRGFGSEMLLMLMARLFAISRGYDFALASRYSNIAWRRGWADYFEPFCEEVDHPLAFEDSVIRTLGSRPRQWLRTAAARALGAVIDRRVLFSFQVWKDIWNSSFADEKFMLPGREAPTDLYTALRVLMREVWRPTAGTAREIEARIAGLGLPAHFAGVHIRRGDKWQEATPVSIDAYVRTIDNVDPAVRSCFVASDSQAAVGDFAAARPEWAVTSLVAPDDDGHHQAVFNAYGREGRRARVLRLLAEIEVLTQASFFVGTFSSNMGVVLALLRGVDSCHGVDGPLRIYRPY